MSRIRRTSIARSTAADAICTTSCCSSKSGTCRASWRCCPSSRAPSIPSHAPRAWRPGSGSSSRAPGDATAWARTGGWTGGATCSRRRARPSITWRSYTRSSTATGCWPWPPTTPAQGTSGGPSSETSEAVDRPTSFTSTYVPRPVRTCRSCWRSRGSRPIRSASGSCSPRSPTRPISSAWTWGAGRPRPGCESGGDPTRGAACAQSPVQTLGDRARRAARAARAGPRQAALRRGARDVAAFEAAAFRASSGTARRHAHRHRKPLRRLPRGLARDQPGPRVADPSRSRAAGAAPVRSDDCGAADARAPTRRSRELRAGPVWSDIGD